MKFPDKAEKPVKTKSRPARGVWIEICNARTARGSSRKSRPARGVWIEITIIAGRAWGTQVTPRKGRVD